MNLLDFDVAQSQGQIDLFDETFDRFGVTTFVELGVYRGGLSNYVLETRPHIDYWGFDNQKEQVDIRIREHPRIIIADVFDHSCIERIRGIVNSCSGTAMIFCDDGNKPKEMEVYCGILRSGDLLQGHDYHYLSGEITDKTLDAFAAAHPEMYEIDRQKFRDMGTSLWRKS